MAPGGRKRATEAFTPLELEIMQVLWDSGPSTASDVQSRLESKLAYTTVQTMLQVLFRKKRVDRDLDGRAYRYLAVMSREKAKRSALDDLVSRMFGGSAEALLVALVDTRRITADEIARASKLINPSSDGDDEQS